MLSRRLENCEGWGVCVFHWMASCMLIAKHAWRLVGVADSGGVCILVGYLVVYCSVRYIDDRL